jgi:DNA-binding transcriptional LysR family regulator
MNIKQLKYFCEVVDSGGVNAASANLFVAPTAISMQVSQLEGDLKGKLFDRSTRPMELTALGKFFYPKAKELINNADALFREAKDIAGGQQGWLSIGFIRSTLFSILPEAIRIFKQQHGQVKIELVEVLSEHQPELLRKGLIHVGVSRFINKVPAIADVRYETLFTDPLVVALPINHPLSSKKELSTALFLETPFIAFPKDPQSTFAKTSVQLLIDQGVVPTVLYEATEIHTALGLVAAGLGATLVGRSVAQHNRPDIKFLPLKDVVLDTTILSVTKDSESNPLVDDFLSILRSLGDAQACLKS